MVTDTFAGIITEFYEKRPRWSRLLLRTLLCLAQSLADLPLPHPGPELGGNKGSGYTRPTQPAAFVTWVSGSAFLGTTLLPHGQLSTIDQIGFLDVGFVFSPKYPKVGEDAPPRALTGSLLRTPAIGGLCLNQDREFFFLFDSLYYFFEFSNDLDQFLTCVK